MVAFTALVTSAVLVPGCGKLPADAGCDTAGCEFTREEWQRVSSLAGLAEPPGDPSNRLVGNEAAIQLGWKLYFEPALSGEATWVDTLGRATSSARAPLGTPLHISCASCHNPAHAGADTASSPGHVSIGAGWYDVNGQQSVNAAYYHLLYWNGRSDSLWGQAAGVIESGVSMNGTRLAVAWAVADKHRAEYEAVFAGEPLPLIGSSAQVAALLIDPAARLGACAATASGCPVGCQPAVNTETALVACVPRFPLKGKRGRKAGCQVGDPLEPAQDAYDCMTEGDRAAIDRVFVNVAKAIGAYEHQLRSRNASFDRFVAEGPASGAISDAARRGARLFVGRASCIDCHSTALLSDNRFHDVGVPQAGPSVPTVSDCYAGNPACDCSLPSATGCLPWGFFDGLGKLKQSPFLRKGVFSDDPARGASHADVYELAAADAQKGQWRTPSLRDVALTGPYMHTGAFRTLEEVVWHYDQGGSVSDGHGKAVELRPLLLSAGDRAALVEFLKTLTGRPDRPELHQPPPGGRL